MVKRDVGRKKTLSVCQRRRATLASSLDISLTPSASRSSIPCALSSPAAFGGSTLREYVQDENGSSSKGMHSSGRWMLRVQRSSCSSALGPRNMKYQNHRSGIQRPWSHTGQDPGPMFENQSRLHSGTRPLCSPVLCGLKDVASHDSRLQLYKPHTRDALPWVEFSPACPVDIKSR